MPRQQLVNNNLSGFRDGFKQQLVFLKILWRNRYWFLHDFQAAAGRSTLKLLVMLACQQCFFNLSQCQKRDSLTYWKPKNTFSAIDAVNKIQLNIDKQTFSLASALSRSYWSSLPLITHSFGCMFQRGGVWCNLIQTAPPTWLFLIQALNKLDESTNSRQHVWPQWKSICMTLWWFLYVSWMTVGKMPHHLEGRLCRAISSNWSAALQNNL